MNQLKLCMVGSFAVGKSSLVQRYVKSIFSDKYHTTVGVKIDKKDVLIGDETVRIMIWDLAGDDAFSRLQTTFLRGAAGYLLVADGTRAGTLEAALRLNRDIEAALGRLPFALALNKDDLSAAWEVEPDRVLSLEQGGMKVFRTSAKDGRGVESIFEHFAALHRMQQAS
jgi:small GTP-binding protein